MTLPSRHMIRNLSPGSLRPSTLPLGHGGSQQYWIFMSERGKCFFETWGPDWGSNPRSPNFQAGSFNHCTRAPALTVKDIMYPNNISYWTRPNVVLKLVQHSRRWTRKRRGRCTSIGPTVDSPPCACLAPLVRNTNNYKCLCFVITVLIRP